jgi:hypothetical protein
VLAKMFKSTVSGKLDHTEPHFLHVLIVVRPAPTLDNVGIRGDGKSQCPKMMPLDGVAIRKRVT